MDRERNIFALVGLGSESSDCFRGYGFLLIQKTAAPGIVNFSYQEARRLEASLAIVIMLLHSSALQLGDQAVDELFASNAPQRSRP
jgi:hypothetical protein